jgi:hypothetical protein
MKTAIPAIILILISVSLYGQNENPYSVFGYEAPVMLDKTETVDKLLLINNDSTSSVWMLAVDPSNRTITIFDRNKVALQYDTLTNYTMMRWLSPDPYGQFSSPYLGMGNKPHMGVDPDGGLFGLSKGWSMLAGAGIGFAVGAGAAVLTGNEDDWWKWGALGAVAGGAVGYATGDPMIQHGSKNARSISGGQRHNNTYSTQHRSLKHPKFTQWQEQTFSLAKENTQLWDIAKEYSLSFSRKKGVKKIQFGFNEFWGSAGQWVSRDGKQEVWDVNKNWDWLDTPIFSKRGTYRVTHYQIFPSEPPPTLMSDGTLASIISTPVLDIQVKVKRQIHGRYGKTASYGWTKISAP